MRSFTILDITKTNGNKVNYTEGRFIGETPGSVVKKCFSHAYRHCRKNCNSMKITIRETTQNSLKKEYRYRVTRIKDHRIVERDGEEIEYTYSTRVKSIN